MLFSIQKANMWKRFAAWMLDAILVLILATGAGSGFSALLGYDAQYQVVNDGYARYEAQYGVSLDISYEEYGALSEAERKNWDEAANALRTDEAVLEAYSNVIGLTLLITALSVLVAVVICEFVVPLFLHNGQTVGKKIFGLCLIRNDGVKVNNLQLLTRALLCKGTLETLVPAFALLTVSWGISGVFGIAVLVGVLLAPVVCVCASKNNAALHDLMAGTIVVDAASQRIFGSTEDLVEYQKKVAAERAAQQKY